MKILLVHNRYLQRGGEDVAVEYDRELLASGGHSVVEYGRSNDEIDAMTKARLVGDVLWSRRSARDVAELVASHRPDVAHVHNVFPLISPSVLWRLRALGVPVVMTVHNFRLVCANGLHLRAGRICESCVGKPIPWPAVRHACYQGDRGRTTIVVASQVLHRALRSHARNVARFVAPSRFLADRLVAAGLPEQKVVVRGHAMPEDPGVGSHSEPTALFVGRLAAEKGIHLLLEAWRRRRTSRLQRLRIVGEGPLRGDVVDAAARDPSIEWMGSLPRPDVLDLMRSARFLIAPSMVYETFGLIVLEAFAAGLPVIASDQGAMGELVADGVGGRVLDPRQVDPWARAIDELSEDDGLVRDLGARARAAYERRFAPDVGYRALLDVYREVGVSP